MSWRERAARSVAHMQAWLAAERARERREAPKARDYARSVLLDHMESFAEIAAPHLFGVPQRKGGEKVKQQWTEPVERRVLELLPLVPVSTQPANLVADLVRLSAKHRGRALTRKETVRDTLRRLAHAGKLDDPYRAYFLRPPKPRTR